MSTNTQSVYFRLVLQQELAERTKLNSAYSLRAFARFLKIDFSSLSKIMRGKIGIGPKLIRRLGTRLGLNNQEIEYLTISSESIPDSFYQYISNEQFDLISDWFNFAILELIKLKEFKNDFTWIANKLGISKEDAEKSISRMIEINLISFEDGRYIDHSNGFSSTILKKPTSKSLKLQQHQILKMAQDALYETPVEKRSQSSMTFAINSQKIDQAKELIKSFRREMGLLLSQDDELDEVYHLSVSLYPITKTTISQEQK
ncbi:MAG: DUF4423 domain-containing protein [Bacteriovoracaceae bacterium]|nr:DUF4423 domain-containing protein [Bacteriovoracaceae bacterium]